MLKLNLLQNLKPLIKHKKRYKDLLLAENNILERIKKYNSKLTINMKNKKHFYITTPIYYTNAPIHLGGAYTTIAADVLARWHSLLGEEVFFLTGTDEHGQKIQEIAEQNNQKPKEFVDKIVAEFKEAFKMLNISNNNFIRTTDKYHEEEVKKLLTELYKKKLIYKGHYESLYCVGCEQYLTQSDLVDGKCPLHNREPELKKEEAYLFKLSAFEKQLKELIKSGKYEILPEERKKEVLSFINLGLQDVSISRLKSKISWGIELPFDKNHTVWVWPDAFWNYVSGLRQTGKANFDKFWPVDVQLMAKDIIRVHATIWPALLLGAGYKLPKTLFVHGYFTIDGQKMSKSLGNVISPIDLTNKYGADSVRYYLMRNLSFGSDGDVSEHGLVDRNNSELANKLGNLISRVSALAEQNGIERCENKLIKKLKLKEIDKLMENYELDKALNLIFEFIDACNLYVQEKKPWETKSGKVLHELADSIKAIAILLWPFMPETSKKIACVFNFKISFNEIQKPLKPSKIKKAEVLFKKIEIDEKKEEKLNKHEVINKGRVEGIIKMSQIDFKEWEKLELVVGEIEKVEDISGADKLYKLIVNIGHENRTLCAGLKQFYSKEDLKGKKVIVFANLTPRVMKGIESKGMLLAAESADGKSVSLIQPDGEIENGARVR
jgi:methionyl-tRNA synthetase